MIANGLHLDLDATAGHAAPLSRRAGVPADPDQAGMTPDEQAFIEAHRNELPELETIDEERRLYPRDGFAAHLIGYVGEVSEDDAERSRATRPMSRATWWARRAWRRPTTRFCAGRTARAM